MVHGDPQADMGWCQQSLIGSAYDSRSQGHYAKEGIRGLLCKSGMQEQCQDIRGRKVRGHPTNDYLGWEGGFWLSLLGPGQPVLELTLLPWSPQY